MKSIILICILSAFPFFGSAQKSVELSYANFLNEYNVFLKKQPVEGYSIKVKNANYFNESDAKPFEQTSSTLLVSKESSFAFESKEGLMLQNGDIRLNIDTLNKIVYILKSIEYRALTQVSDLSSLDSVGLKVKKIVSSERTVFVLEQLIENGSFHKVRMEFNNKTNQIVKIEIVYWPGDYFNESDEVTFETPKTVYDYTEFKKIESGSIDQRYQVSNWISDKKELLASVASSGYVLKDLRVKR